MKLVLKLSGGLLVLIFSIWALILTAQINVLSLILSIAIIVTLLGGYFFELRKTKDHEFSLKLLFEMIFLIVAGIVTYFITKALNPIIAASLIGLTGAMLFLDYKDSIYVGAFAGMSSIFEIQIFLIVILIVAIAYFLLKNQFDGIGGKGGLTAFIGTFIVALFLNYEIKVFTLTILEYLILIGVAVASSMLTYFLGKSLDNNVLSSSFLGLLFGVSLLFSGDDIVLYIALVGYGSTFIGMQSRYKFYLMPIASIIFVFLYGYSYIFKGLGGFLGFYAFLSSVPIVLCQELVNIKQENPLII